MTGTPAKQIATLWRHAPKCDTIGESKHNAKLEARADGYTQSTELSRYTGISSFSAKDANLGTWEALATFAREPLADGTPGIKDINRLTPAVVEAFLRAAAERGVCWATFSQYGSRLNKLGDALTSYSEKFCGKKAHVTDFRTITASLRTEFRKSLDRKVSSRAYERPRALIAAMKSPVRQLVARLQLEAKLRISSATLIRAQDLRGVSKDSMSGKEVGYIYDHDSKGGKPNTVPCEIAVYRELEAYILANGELSVKDHSGYRQELRDAAAATGQKYTGSHGLRWNGAQERLLELKALGCSYPEALQTLSRELNHERLSISQIYTRGIEPW
jgi:hypothetical protein